MSLSELTNYLSELGLTEYEAKTLTTLFKLKEAQAPQISQTSQVPKTRVYDILERLAKKGLIIEVSGRPKKYKCLETEKVFEVLLNEIKEKTRGLEEKAVLIRSSISESAPESDAEKVLKVKDKNDFARILAQEIDSAKKSVVGFSNFVYDNNFLLDAMHRAVDKKIDIKLISQNTEKALAQDLAKKGAQVKQSEHDLEAFIVDDKKVILSMNNLSSSKNGFHFTIWPNSTHMANVFSHYFNKVWTQEK